ncbi:hypothetical protein [Pseudomonas sp. NPDC086278]|uniref:hypothetical protein n=1 Tax=Pseudomonas sp. NPDC086278 TaxID=3390646 RepID=UPI003D084E98
MLSDQSPFGPLPSVVARKSANARAAIRVVRPSGKYACTGKSAIFQLTGLVYDVATGLIETVVPSGLLRLE